MAKKEIKQKQITVVILNQNGDDRHIMTLEETIATAVKEYFQRGRFLYVNTNHFAFSAQSETNKEALLDDTNRLRSLLDTEGDVVVTLTGKIVGGKKC